MDKRLPLFMLLAMGILVGSQLLMRWLDPVVKPVAKPVDKGNNTAPVHQGTGTVAANQGSGTVAVAQGTGANLAEATPDGASAQSEPDPNLPEQYVTLGSLDPKQPARMLVTITNRGAAVVRAFRW